MTGPELAAELDALLARRPDLCHTKIGIIIRNKSNGIDDIRICRTVKPKTIAKVRAFIAEPDAAKRIPRSEYRRLKNPALTALRKAAAVRRNSAQKAREQIAAGVQLKDISQAAVRMAGIAVMEQLRDQERQRDPVEQAKLKLQKARYAPVCSMGVYGGDKSLYRVGSRRNVSQDELLRMAAAA